MGLLDSIGSLFTNVALSQLQQGAGGTEALQPNAVDSLLASAGESSFDPAVTRALGDVDSDLKAGLQPGQMRDRIGAGIHEESEV